MHKCTECKHEKLKYCEHCQKVYCCKCGREWGGSTYYYPLQWTYTYDTDTISDDTSWQATWGHGDVASDTVTCCSHS